MTLAFALTALATGCGDRSTGPPLTIATERVLPPDGPYVSVYSFKGGSDGATPLKHLLNEYGVLYGTTSAGGTGSLCENGCGTVFEITTSGKENVLYSFKGGSDGANPVAGLIRVNDQFYGTTLYGGTENFGTIYSIGPTGEESVLHSFGKEPDGRYPIGGLIYVRHTLYGTTYEGGGSRHCDRRHGAGADAPGYPGCGSVFEATLSGSETIVHKFNNNPDGAYPSAGLFSVRGTLYGTTWGGGHYESFCGSQCGTVFSIDSEGREHVVYRFKGPPDGFNPTAPLLFNNGDLYGTTTEGGRDISGGSVFRLGLSGQESVIASFLIQPWYPGPTAGLTYVNGNFYGTTEYNYNGSASAPGDGSVFKLSPSGKLTVLHVFKGGVDGKNPQGALVNVNGTLYGTTSAGGTAGFGTIFKITP
ncbi:MAG: choice-of-anchor tandem repeat GloVer-containing protein [Candidatus Tumulicola sp.]